MRATDHENLQPDIRPRSYMNEGLRRIMVVAGEASADRYGARLVRRLRARSSAPDLLRFYGTGGDEMAAAGVELLCHIRDLANIGPREAFANLSRYYAVYRQLIRSCRLRPPSVAVLIDFPEFNLRLARKLHAAGSRVVYYVGPQIWAWRRGRVRLVRRYVDRMAVILPFEEEFYRRYGVEAEFVGHPLLEEFGVTRKRFELLGELDLNPDLPTIALLPGSRSREVEHILPVLLEASLALIDVSEAQVVVSVAPTVGVDQIRRLIRKYAGVERHPRICPTTAPARDLLACCDFAYVKSGTSTLEAALVGTPFVIVYRISALSWLLGKILIRSQFKGLVNLIVGREAVPEYIQGDATAEALVRVGRELLGNPDKRRRMSAELSRVRELLGTDSASEEVASIVENYFG